VTLGQGRLGPRGCTPRGGIAPPSQERRPAGELTVVRAGRAIPAGSTARKGRRSPDDGAQRMRVASGFQRPRRAPAGLGPSPYIVCCSAGVTRSAARLKRVVVAVDELGARRRHHRAPSRIRKAVLASHSSTIAFLSTCRAWKRNALVRRAASQTSGLWYSAWPDAARVSPTLSITGLASAALSHCLGITDPGSRAGPWTSDRQYDRMSPI